MSRLDSMSSGQFLVPYPKALEKLLKLSKELVLAYYGASTELVRS